MHRWHVLQELGFYYERGLDVTSLRNAAIFLGLVLLLVINKTRNSSTG